MNVFGSGAGGQGSAETRNNNLEEHYHGDMDHAAELLARFRHRKIHRRGACRVEITFPAPPETIADLGVGFDLLLKLILKHLFTGGSLRVDDLAARMAIPISLLEDPIQFLRKEALIEARGAGSSGVSGLMSYSLGERGRQRAMGYMDENSYCGPVPVSLEGYRAQIAAQTVRDQLIDQARVAEIFQEIVIKPEVLTQIGAAFNSGRAMFLYGPAGVGKTFLASQMAKLLYGDVVVPYAVMVEGQIIKVFDPANHVPVEKAEGEQAASSLLRAEPKEYDARWVRCERPVIVAGGELGLALLDLQYQPDTRYYEAPLQMKANGGLFMIDDLGRQNVPTAALLNRWIVPLESSVDYLSLHTGGKFQIPFDTIPLFSTNLRPEDLADDAFLRRMGYKIEISYLTEKEYRTVFEQYCAANDMEYEDQVVDYLINDLYGPASKPLVACHPRDIIGQVIDYSLFEGKNPHITRDMMDRAWKTYFFSE